MANAQASGVWLLFFVLAWSGVSKLDGLASTANAFTSFGVTRRPSRWAAVGLAAVELSVALSLGLSVVIERAWRAQSAPLVVAGVLFASFALLIGRSLSRGAQFACNCFGSSTELLSVFSLLRAIALCSLTIALLLAHVEHVQRTTTASALILNAITGLGALGLIVCLDALRRTLLAVRGARSLTLGGHR